MNRTGGEYDNMKRPNLGIINVTLYLLLLR